MDDRTGPGKPRAIPAHRLTRLTRFGTMAAGVAGNMAMGGMAELARGRRPEWQSLLLTPGNLRRVTDELARMRGAAMKLGQLVSMDTGDLLPKELAEIMARLRAEADFMPPAQLKKVLKAEWPERWLSRFARFDTRPIAAASIGQVHRAQLKDGRDVAIKVQYPGVARSIDSDVANVASLIKMTGLIPKGFKLDPYIEEARLQLHAETDYRAEAAHLSHFHGLLADDDRYILPAVQNDWTTGRILTMTYVPSQPLEAAEALDQIARDRLAHDLVDLLLRELFDFQIMQTDPNFANFRLDSESERLVLLDFGATRAIAPEIVALYHRLMAAGLAGDREGLRAVAVEIGFFLEDTPEQQAGRILNMMGMVFDAIRAAPLYDFGDQRLTRAMNAEGAALAESGFVPPSVPMDVVFLQRKFAGVFLIAANLGARVALVDLLRKHLDAYAAQASAAQ